MPDTDNQDAERVERPSKRARLATTTSNQNMNDLRSDIVISIYSLLGLQVDAALAGLGQNAAYVTTSPIATWEG